MRQCHWKQSEDTTPWAGLSNFLSVTFFAVHENEGKNKNQLMKKQLGCLGDLLGDEFLPMWGLFHKPL